MLAINGSYGERVGVSIREHPYKGVGKTLIFAAIYPKQKEGAPYWGLLRVSVLGTYAVLGEYAVLREYAYARMRATP